ncbi:MAG: bifunctional [glutamine synthetase] adenylyltransferase/[glutamine synthetase]-adenylyl-L-tyrosine phosphorylase [Proteobacteria bacterium]|nr:bifunctional [glutamine synthetase] adenylyltransferase/[glutamine synthetase]-adenylyl-L-tyrosine phosphorylase [Pseudomonadota bacterium]
MPRLGFPFADNFAATAYDITRAQAVLADLRQAGDALAEPADRSALDALWRDGSAVDLLLAIFGNSPFLSRMALSDVAYLPRLFSDAPEQNLAELVATLARGLAAAAEMDEAMMHLRVARRRAAILVALGDVGGIWNLDQVTNALSQFADAAIGGAVCWLLRDAGRRGELSLVDETRPGFGSGLIILGMGKLGANELNYSSDVDLIALYDDEVVPYIGKRTAQDCYIRLIQALVRMLQQPTRDGYVLRTDLRLRPDPGVTPVAVSVQAAEQYYESLGQNWERAAMIKARPVAGDLTAGAAFLEHLQPFIWRRNLDYAAIADIHSIMRKIHHHAGDGEISAMTIEGHNVKLGRGGIRDIEFFAQTQQLIAGGREPTLRVPATCDALDALARGGWIDGAVAEELTLAYEYLRRLEHRLQMVGDEQTQTMPRTPEGVAHLGCFMGQGGDGHEAGRFRAELLHHLDRVHLHHGILFDTAPALLGDDNLIFSGTDEDTETLQKLADMGFEGVRGAVDTVRGWHHGRYRALRSTRARELLTTLLPSLLKAIADTANPNATLGRFDRFLSNLPAGVQLFSMLTARPQLLELLAEIMGSAPRLANYLAENSNVVDAMISAEFLAAPPTLTALQAAFAAELNSAADFQDVLDLTRRRVKERKFQIGVQILGSTIDADRSGGGYADLAQAAVASLLPWVRDAFSEAERHGGIDQGALAVLAMGKLGSREMTGESDLDLIFVYDYPDDDSVSDGARPLSAQQYFSRLCQRLINAMTVPTAEGKLYEVDMRLRPSGNSGPVATRFDGFGDYQRNQAWTWEHMALTRARAIAGDASLVDRVRDTIKEVLCRPRDRKVTATDVVAMRQRLVKQGGRSGTGPWDLKMVRGGLLDIEFITQFLQLTHAAEAPEMLHPNTCKALSNLAQADFLSRRQADDLIAASGLYRDLMALIRVAVVGEFDPTTAPRGTVNAVLRIAETATVTQLERRLAATQAGVLAAFQSIVEEEAGGAAIR